MAEKLRGDTKVRAVRIEASKVNGSLSKAVEAEAGPVTNNDLPLLGALARGGSYAVIRVNGKHTATLILP